MFSSWSCMERQSAVVSEHFLYLDLLLNLSYCRLECVRGGMGLPGGHVSIYLV